MSTAIRVVALFAVRPRTRMAVSRPGEGNQPRAVTKDSDPLSQRLRPVRKSKISIVSRRETTPKPVFQAMSRDAFLISARSLRDHSTAPVEVLTPASSVLVPTSSNRSYASPDMDVRSEEHTSELQSPCNLVCRLLLEKKKKNVFKNNPRKPDSRTSVNN